MSAEKNIKEKIRLHLRNKNREKYDLSALIEAVPELQEHIKPNKSGEDSVDFGNPAAVKLLNFKALELQNFLPGASILKREKKIKLAILCVIFLYCFRRYFPVLFL